MMERFNMRGVYSKAMFEGGEQERARRGVPRMGGGTFRISARESDAQHDREAVGRRRYAR